MARVFFWHKIKDEKNLGFLDWFSCPQCSLKEPKKKSWETRPGGSQEGKPGIRQGRGRVLPIARKVLIQKSLGKVHTWGGASPKPRNCGMKDLSSPPEFHRISISMISWPRWLLSQTDPWQIFLEPARNSDSFFIEVPSRQQRVIQLFFCEAMIIRFPPKETEFCVIHKRERFLRFLEQDEDGDWCCRNVLLMVRSWKEKKVDL